MQFSKMACQECIHYKSCPLRTRMFINYCGSRAEEMRKSIRAARIDCKSRRSFILQYRSSPVLPRVPA